MNKHDMQQDNVDRSGSDAKLQKAVEEKAKSKRKLFGTFSGVFSPTLLTILGVIMYLRTGWVVGNAGLLGAFAIILLSFAITSCTGLSLSSVTTNIRIGAGGAFSIISQSLGLEVGGSIGVPLYLSQALAVSMYIFGFREGWQWIFPEHPALVVDLGLFAVLFVIAFISAGLAFKIQYLIMAVIGLSLVSVAVATFGGSMQESITWWGDFRGSPETDFQGIGFWAVFAVFFPASTGIMAGANMSGELKDARKSIPIGTMSAIAVSLAVYLGLALWLAFSADNTELTSNYTVMVDKAAWGPAILAGLLGATFSSALSSLVGAPRILQALGEHKILPRAGWLARRSASGEPRNALMLTGAIVIGALMLRSLNAVAPLITMFFLITYGMINVVVLIEQKMHLVSFRPLLRVPRLIPWIGFAGCLFAMFIVNAVFSILAIAVVLVIHGFLIRRHLKAPFGDVRNGLFVAVAEWAAKKVADLTASRERTWKANLLVPTEEASGVEELFELIRAMAYPRGFIKLAGLTDRTDTENLMTRLPDLAERFRDQGVFSSWTSISAATFGANLRAGIQTFSGTFFRPTVLLLQLPKDETRDDEMADIMRTSIENGIGVALTGGRLPNADDSDRSLTVWFRDRGPEWNLEMDLDNQDLAVLLGYKLKQSWTTRLQFTAICAEDGQKDQAKAFLERFADLARIPNAATAVVKQRPDDLPDEAGFKSSDTAVNVLPVSNEPDFAVLRQICAKYKGCWLFTHDSGQESALA